MIACGGAGEPLHFAEVLRETSVDAAAAANFFQHYEHSVYLVHKELLRLGVNVRPPDFQQL
jgi:imidazole glycerol phosphate synthase subunit HisF